MKYFVECFIYFFFININLSFAQEVYSREVIVTIDTVREFNNTRKPGSISDTYLERGIELKILETPFRVPYMAEKKDNNLNGIYLRFYYPSNMPKIKGTYLDGEEDGEWFSWNEKGVLIRKEIWRKGKLLKTIKYK